MAGQAQITSVEAIEAFRAQLVVYLAPNAPGVEKKSARRSGAYAGMAGGRPEAILAPQEMRIRSRKLEDAKQELFTTSMSKLGSSSFQQMAVQKAQREGAHRGRKTHGHPKMGARAGEQIRAAGEADAEQLHGFLAVDMDKAVAYLDQALTALAARTKVCMPTKRRKYRRTKMNLGGNKGRITGLTWEIYPLGGNESSLARRQGRGV